MGNLWYCMCMPMWVTHRLCKPSIKHQCCESHTLGSPSCPSVWETAMWQLARKDYDKLFVPQAQINSHWVEQLRVTARSRESRRPLTLTAVLRQTRSRVASTGLQCTKWATGA